MYHVIKTSDSHKVMDQTQYKEYCISECKDMDYEDSEFESEVRNDCVEFAYEMNNLLIESPDSISDMFSDYFY